MKKSHPPYILIPFEMLTDSRLKPMQTKVLTAICSWRKAHTNLVRISRQMISERTGYPVYRISNITTSLVKLGWLKKTGNGGKSQWSEYEIQKSDTVSKSDTLGVSKSDTLGVSKSDTRIDTERKYRKKVHKEKKSTKKKIPTYSQKVLNFKPTKKTEITFQNKYPLLGKKDYLELLEQFKDQALNRKQPFKDLNAGFRIYLNRGYVEPVKQVVRKNKINSFRDLGDTVRANQAIKKKSSLPKQILING